MEDNDINEQELTITRSYGDWCLVSRHQNVEARFRVYEMFKHVLALKGDLILADCTGEKKPFDSVQDCGSYIINSVNAFLDEWKK